MRGFGGKRMPRIRIWQRILLIVTVTWVGVADAGWRTELGRQLCYAAIGDGKKDGVLDVCIDVAPGIMSGTFFLSGAMTLCRGFAGSPERQLACYDVLSQGHYGGSRSEAENLVLSRAHQEFKSGYRACLDDSEGLTVQEQVVCIEKATEVAQNEMKRENNLPFARTLCKKVHGTKQDKTVCLERIDTFLGTHNSVELGLDVCGRASSQAQQIDCYQYTFRQYHSNRSMNERLKSCNRTHERKSLELAACLKSELEEVLATYRAHTKKRETMIADALAFSAATP